VPFDTRPPAVTSGIRIGTPAATTRGFGEAEMHRLGNGIADVLDATSDTAVIERVQADMKALCQQFPVYG
jgi:glycine hydroxymethyltransferase